MTSQKKNLTCDYLVIGSGAASIAFIDTLLTEIPSTKVILVDRKKRPGGHWVDAYGYVRLHQPSLLYGVQSRQLEGNWWKLMLTKFMLPWKHRASKDEILEHFGTFVDDKVKAGQVEYFPECDYDFTQENYSSDNIYTFSTLTDNKTNEEAITYEVKVKHKLVNGVLGECVIPSQHPLQFPVDEKLCVVTPNELYSANEQQQTKGKYSIFSLAHLKRAYLKRFISRGGDHAKGCSGTPSFQFSNNQHYIVLGCGKTAMDTIVFLLTEAAISPSRVSWIIPNDVWVLRREANGADPSAVLQALLQFDGDASKATAKLETDGIFTRLDPAIQPSKFRAPVVGADELKLMRMIPSIVRRGRVTSIEIMEDGTQNAVLNFGPNAKPWCPPTHSKRTSHKDCVFIHCTSPGPSNGNNPDFDVFQDQTTINLGLIFLPPVSLSMSSTAYLESALTKGQLDVEFARKVVAELYKHSSSKDAAESKNGEKEDNDKEILQQIFYQINSNSNNEEGGDGGVEDLATSSYRHALNTALLLAVGNPDPRVVLQWLKSNRLSMLSIPGAKSHIYEIMLSLSEKGDKICGLTEDEMATTKLLAEKLKPLKGL